MSRYQNLSTDLSQKLDDAFSYLGLEVDSDGEIYRFGLVTPTDLWDVDRTQAGEIKLQLLHLCQTKNGLCGHNIRRFDYPHLGVK